MKVLSIWLAITAFLALSMEAISWLVVGSAPLDVRYECAANAPDENYKIFSFGGSTVFGIPVSEYGFMAQITAATTTSSDRRVSVCNMGEGGRDSTGVLLDIERTLQYRPDAIILMTGHNEFLQPVFDSPAARRLREQIVRLATFRLFTVVMEKITRRLAQPVVQPPLPEELLAHDRSGADFQARVARYQGNVDAMVEAIQDAGVPLIIGTLPKNLDAWPPVFKKIALGEGGVRDEASVTEMLDLIETGNLSAAEERFNLMNWQPDEVQAPVVKYVAAHFLPKETQVEQKSRYDEFVRISDLDPIPWRVLTQFNEYVQTKAADKQGITLVDTAELLRNAAEDGTPGYDMITDNAHPTPESNYLIARALLDAVESVQGKQIPWSKQDANNYIANLAPALELEYLLRNGVYVMKVPFFNYTASRRYLEEARNKWPEDWRSWANLASIELLVGDPQRGKDLLRHALSLQPDQQLYLGHQHSPYLKDALAAQALSFEMILAEESAVEPGVEDSVEPIDGA